MRSVKMKGEIFGKNISKSFDIISEDPPTPAVPNGLLDLKYVGLGRHVSLADVSNAARMNDIIQRLRTAFDERPNSIGNKESFGALKYNFSL